jgi:hypothetical protein
MELSPNNWPKNPTTFRLMSTFKVPVDVVSLRYYNYDYLSAHLSFAEFCVTNDALATIKQETQMHSQTQQIGELLIRIAAIVQAMPDEARAEFESNGGRAIEAATLSSLETAATMDAEVRNSVHHHGKAALEFLQKRCADGMVGTNIMAASC